MKKQFVFTIDLERDVPGVLHETYYGVDEGLPVLRDFFKSNGIAPDIFVSAELSTHHEEILKELGRDFVVGNHGYEHGLLLRRSWQAQKDDITMSTRIIEELTGAKVKQFRAPNFSISGTTIEILDDLGYLVDSSVMPGRRMKRRGLFTMYDFRGAPTVIYHPNPRDVTQADGTRIVEIPLTENPMLPGAPLGMGFLNKSGIKRTNEALSLVSGDYVIFLIHSWECVDILRYLPWMAREMAELCNGDIGGLTSLLHSLDDDWEIVTLMELHDMWVNSPRESNSHVGEPR